MPRLLLIEDDLDLARMLEEYLVPEGFAVALRHDGTAAPEAMAAFDLVVLDVMLPKRSGFELLRNLRRYADTPVIMLTARDSETDRVVGLELGADDYVPKPFDPRELVARIRAVLRRARRAEAAHRPARKAELSVVRVGDVTLDARLRRATRAGRVLHLTPAEFDLLERLLQDAGRVVSRSELGRAALGRAAMGRVAMGHAVLGRGGAAGVDRNVDALVGALRRKLGQADLVQGDLVKKVRNVGYCFALPPRSPPGTMH